MKPIAFFDLDGTIRDTGGVVYPHARDISIRAGIRERLLELRNHGYLIAGATNQGGVAKAIITSKDAEDAIERTQELLGNARLDIAFYCPHEYKISGYYCDCKKPAPGMLLDALSALHGSTLEGAFMVGDDRESDGGAAHTLGIPYFHIAEFQRGSIDDLLDRLPGRRQIGHQPDPNRVVGGLVGYAIGYSLGRVREARSHQEVGAEFLDAVLEVFTSPNMASVEYIDELEIVLILADSLLENDGLNPHDLARCFRDWARPAVENQICRVIAMPGYEKHPERCAREDYEAHPENGAGNRAVMRCMPIALHHCRSLPALLADSRRSARLTHGDPKAQSSCVLVNVAIRHLVLGGDRDQPWRYGMEYLTEYEKQSWHRMEHIADLCEREIRSSENTVDTVEAAMWSFARTKTFEDAIRLAVSLEGDATAVASMAGAVCGAYYGYQSIPQHWHRALKNEPRIRSTALRLADVSLQHSRI